MLGKWGVPVEVLPDSKKSDQAENYMIKEKGTVDPEERRKEGGGGQRDLIVVWGEGQGRIGVRPKLQNQQMCGRKDHEL